MTPNQFFAKLSETTKSQSFEMKVELQINTHDAMAARLLIWLQEQMPDATTGDLEDVLDAAKWWSVLFASMHTAAQPCMEPTSATGL